MLTLEVDKGIFDDLRHFKMRPRISIRGFANLSVRPSVSPSVGSSISPSIGPSVGRSVGNPFFQRANLDEKSTVIIPILPPPLPLPLPPLPPPPILSLPPLPINIRVNRGGWGGGGGGGGRGGRFVNQKWPKKRFFSIFVRGVGVAGTLETNRRALKLKV